MRNVPYMKSPFLAYIAYSFSLQVQRSTFHPLLPHYHPEVQFDPDLVLVPCHASTPSFFILPKNLDVVLNLRNWTMDEDVTT